MQMSDNAHLSIAYCNRNLINYVRNIEIEMIVPRSVGQLRMICKENEKHLYEYDILKKKCSLKDIYIERH